MIRVYQGDNLKVLSMLQEQFFDAVITDPPYASGASTKAGKAAPTSVKYTNRKKDSPYPDFAGDSVDQRVWMLWMIDVFRAAIDLCNPGAVIAAFCDWRQLPALSDAIQRAGWIWRGIAVWDKVSSRPQRGRFRNQAEYIVWGSKGDLHSDRPVGVLPGVYRYPNVQTNQRLHQTQKPLQLMQDVIRLCVPGGAILDPFCGSGSTLEAARLQGYDAVGIELVPSIAQVAAKRLNTPLQQLSQ